MPTLGWVYEDSVEAYGNAHDHTPDPGHPLPKLFCCPFCHFSDPRLRPLQDHLHSAHSVARPMLLLDGRECSAEATIRSSTSPAVINCKSISATVDGERHASMSEADLHTLFLSSRNSNVILDLRNSDSKERVTAHSSYRIEFRIPHGSEMALADLAFREYFVDAPLTMDAVTAFTRDARCTGQAKEYAGGLASYCVGTLLKEQSAPTQLTTSISSSRSRFREALEILGAINRPLPKLLTRLIRFHYNDFRSADTNPPFEQLDQAISTLTGNLLLNKTAALPSARRADRVPICPVDHSTGQIIDLSSTLLKADRWSRSLSLQCKGMLDLNIHDPDDRMKVFALWAANAYRLGATEEAIEPLSAISAIFPFSLWAEQCLNEIDPKR